MTINGVPTPLQQAMVSHQLDYWHRPEAMWMLLGLYALGGCVATALLEKWLTQGARVDKAPS